MPQKVPLFEKEVALTEKNGGDVRAQMVKASALSEIVQNPVLKDRCTITERVLRTDSGSSAALCRMPPNAIAIAVVTESGERVVSISCLYDGRFTITQQFGNDEYRWEKFWEGELPFAVKRMKEIIRAYPDKSKALPDTGTQSPHYEALFARLRERRLAREAAEA